MRSKLSKAMIAAVAALGIGAASVATTGPAAAQGYWHGGGYGGWHGGGWHGGWGRGGYYRGGYYNGWWGPAVALGALTAGAIALGAANNYGYGYGYPYGYNCIQVRPLYSADGVYLGRGRVNVCQ